MTLTELISRVEKARGPLRKIDRAVAELAGEEDDPCNYIPYACARSYTSSIDAVVALIDLVLPNCAWLLNTDDLRGAEALLIDKTKPAGERWAHNYFGPTAALALLLATLKALEEEERT